MRVAVISAHTCPLAAPGGKETGGMNVYVRDLSRALSRRGIYVDVYTRSQNPTIPRVSTKLAEHGRVIHRDRHGGRHLSGRPKGWESVDTAHRRQLLGIAGLCRRTHLFFQRRG